MAEEPKCYSTSAEKDVTLNNFLFTFFSNFVAILCQFQDVASYLSRVADFSYPRALGVIVGVGSIRIVSSYLSIENLRVPGHSAALVA